MKTFKALTFFSFLFLSFSAKSQDAQDDGAVFFDRDEYHVCQFIEDSSFTISEILKEQLEVSVLNILPGTYEIIYDDANSYGTVTFNLNDDLAAQGSRMIASGIRIARRKTRNCPIGICACGIGFRCGFTSLQGEDEQDNSRFKTANVSLNFEEKTLTFTFTEYVNWQALND